MNKEIKNNYDDFDICFKFYEKAIEGRNIHYQNYNTWVHYYAIFTGALFIAYYTIIHKENLLLSFLITFVGVLTSSCWHLTVKGHYHWLRSWIKIVHNYEDELAGMCKKNHKKGYRVYSVYLRDKEEKFHENISTQKLTSLFTLLIEITWSILLYNNTYELLEKFNNSYYCKMIIYCFAFIITDLVNVICYLFFAKESDTKEMKDCIS